MNSIRENQTEREYFHLWWHCPQSNKRDMAGVAYYDDADGDYRIVLNFFPENFYFLKSIGSTNDQCLYRLVSVKPRGGKGSRFFQGEGFLNKATNEVVIRTAPFSKLLVLGLDGIKQTRGSAS